MVKHIRLEEVWDLLDDALGEEMKLCLLVRDGVVEGNDAFFYD